LIGRKSIEDKKEYFVYMKISVCIFTYNHEKFISQAIESVLNQLTEFDFEIVIGEDLSTDSTRDIVREYQMRYPQKIRAIFSDRNVGAMENYSRTILQCKGEYISLMDGDDYWIYDKKLQSQADFLDKNRHFSFCFHDARILGADGEWSQETCCGHLHKKVVRFEDIICNVHIPTTSILFQREALMGFPPNWFGTIKCPDRPIFLLLAAEGPGFYFKELWSVYRKHSAGFWTGQDYQSQLLTHIHIYKTMNRHYQDRFKKDFCMCEVVIDYVLAIRLLENNRIRRALCYFRKYKRASRQICLDSRIVRSDSLRFMRLYFKAMTVRLMKRIFYNGFL